MATTVDTVYTEPFHHRKILLDSTALEQGWQTKAHRPNWAWSLFLEIMFIQKRVMPTYLHIICGYKSAKRVEE